MKKSFNQYCNDFIKNYNLTINELSQLIGKTEEETKALLEDKLSLNTHEKSRIRKLLEEFTPETLPSNVMCDAAPGVTKEQIMFEYLKAYASNSVIFGTQNLQRFQEQFKQQVRALKPPKKSKSTKQSIMDQQCASAAELITKLFNEFGNRGFEGIDLHLAVELALKYLV